MEIEAERKKRKTKGAVPLSPTSSIFKVCFAFLPSAILAELKSIMISIIDNYYPKAAQSRRSVATVLRR